MNNSDVELFRLPGRNEAVTGAQIMAAVSSATAAAKRTACRRLGIDDHEARFVGLSITPTGSLVSITAVANDGRCHTSASPVLFATKAA